MRLRAEVVYLCRLDLRDDVHEVGAVAKVAIVQFEFVRACERKEGLEEANEVGWLHTLVLILVEVVETACVETGGPADDTVDFVTLLEEQFGSTGLVVSLGDLQTGMDGY